MSYTIRNKTIQTTAVAAKMLERAFIGTELNEKYIAAAKVRIKKIKK